MRRKEPFMARMMLLSELKADNDSVIMAHCEYLSWKDLGKWTDIVGLLKLNSWSLGFKNTLDSVEHFYSKFFLKLDTFFWKLYQTPLLYKVLKWFTCFNFYSGNWWCGLFLISEKFKSFMCFLLCLFN